MGMDALFAILGAAGWLSCLASLTALHLLPTSYHPVRDPVSNYAVSRYGFLYRLQALSSGVCGICLLILLSRQNPALPAWGMIALACYALSRLLIPFFPTDVHPPRTRTGTIHMVLAAITFTGIACAAPALTPALARTAANARIGAGLSTAAWFTDVSAVAFFFAFGFGPTRKVIGLIERGIYLGTILWLGLLFIHLLGGI